MPHPQGPEVVESIDQVIQNGKSLSEIEQWDMNTSKSDPTPSLTEELSSLPHSSRGQSRSTPSSPHYTQTSFQSQSSNQNSPRERHKSVSDRGSNRRSWAQSTEARDETSRSSNSETLEGSLGAGSDESFPGEAVDFLSNEVFQLVIRNPTTAHRFLKFCEVRGCSENLEFLQKVVAYNRLLEEVAQSISNIRDLYVSTESPRHIKVSNSHTTRLSNDIELAIEQVLPGLESIFVTAQDQVEDLLASNLYPRFVQHQITASAKLALIEHRKTYQGMGDSFCLTDPTQAQNVFVLTSDGFHAMTGYSRKDTIHQSPQFMQGELTDRDLPRRLKAAIKARKETVELILNYRKNGDPYWKLLCIAPLTNERGEVPNLFGFQIDCSSTIHSYTDVLRILSFDASEFDKPDQIESVKLPPTPRSNRSQDSIPELKQPRTLSMRGFRKSKSPAKGTKVAVRDEVGMEQELVDRLQRLDLSTQVQEFYNAYSKYFVLSWHPHIQHLLVSHYSTGMLELLSRHRVPSSIFNKEIFSLLAEYSPSAQTSAKTFKPTVRGAIGNGEAVSVEMGLMTGVERKEKRGLSRLLASDNCKAIVAVEEKYVTHWTPCKDVDGRVKVVVLTIALKI